MKANNVDIGWLLNVHAAETVMAMVAAAIFFGGAQADASQACFLRCEAIRAETCAGLDEASNNFCLMSKEPRYADCRARCQIEEGSRKTERHRSDRRDGRR
ncbi:hypothetical protein OGR47_05970 [Methylocystis sp. MJC1]|jgi:hypothetical protein|uniref:hypothetical protein n=1 Tax=Methylocystis sp. MJC1 TaxID=2654282 RepID=UPI0013EE05EA|nr:hypothetical protein [Methylocystis sp. MJC1]MBU6526547.1 hypothetical protein [Methylocystis sp. MJC1]UZX12991.1 hypothetical protein OGR47_05970 [Methylocystis sp. MJC1]